jgi:5-methylcytosine-specific restriction enzyme subunit McrC
VGLECHYAEHTPDIEDNQILAWTLSVLARSGICTERVLPTIRKAYRALHGSVTLLPKAASDCTGRTYDRLNEDYRTLHALCRLFLDHLGTSHERGPHLMVPFLVDMDRLYEQFVAEWLAAHLDPGRIRVSHQERVTIDPSGPSWFLVDLVLREANSDRALMVLDTKYKTTPPAPEDIAQVVAYAEAVGCREAILIYPVRQSHPLDVRVGWTRVRSVAFSVDRDLQQGGRAFVHGALTEVDLYHLTRPGSGS